MATSGDLRAAEESMRRLLADENLPEPDEVEYRETELVFLWHETRTAVVVEVGGEGAAPDGAPGGDGLAGGAPGEDGLAGGAPGEDTSGMAAPEGDTSGMAAPDGDPSGMAQRDGPRARGSDRA